MKEEKENMKVLGIWAKIKVRYYNNKFLLLNCIENIERT